MSVCEKSSDRTIALPLSGLATGELEFDLYIQRPGDGAMNVYLRRGDQVTDRSLKRLKTQCGDAIVVDEAQFADYRNRLIEECRLGRRASSRGLSSIVEDASERFELLYFNGSAEEILREARAIAERIVEELTWSPQPFKGVFEQLSKDNNAFTHGFNVAVFCALLAQELGHHDKHALQTLAEGGLLHDIGKRFLEADICSKPAALDPRERKRIEQHATKGFRQLGARDDVAWETLLMIYQHHERIDGSGYPVGLPGEQIHPFAKICGIVDAFQALTSDRPYRRSIPLHMACTHLMQDSGILFPPEIVRCWVALVMR